MAEPQITPHRITKPIQLLAAWLAGLAIVNASFLAGAAAIHEPRWITGVLVLASVANVPLFLLSIFLLQTRYRPQMQEDAFYSKYLEQTYSAQSSPSVATPLEKPLRELAERIAVEVAKPDIGNQPAEDRIVELLKDSELAHLAERFQESRTLSELHLFPNLWKEIPVAWGTSPNFREDMDALAGAGLIIVPGGKIEDAKLTEIGTAVATRLEKDKKLWNQSHRRHLRPGVEG